LKLKSWILLVSVAIGIVTAATLCTKEVTILYLHNRDRSRDYSIRVNPSERFSYSYTHSIYGEPVVEEFQIQQGRIVLTGVRASHPGILEYYGFGDTEEFHRMDRRFSSILLRVGMGETQRLRVRDRKVSFSEVGERGDQILLGLRSVSLGRYLFQQVFPQTFIHKSQ
jgi:hypothetical protein